MEKTWKTNMKLHFLLVCLLSTVMITAQNYTPLIQKFTLEDGLSSTNLNVFFQDSRGVIWLGASYGLNRYDGTSIKSYTKEDNGLCHNYIRAIAEDGKGNLWVLSGDFGREENQLCILDPINETIYSVEEYTGEPCPFDIKRIHLFPNHKGTFLFKENTPNGDQFYEVQYDKIEKGFTLDKEVTYYSPYTAFKLNKTTYATLISKELGVSPSNTLPWKAVHLHDTGEITELNLESIMSKSQSYGAHLSTNGEHLLWIFEDNVINNKGIIINEHKHMYIDDEYFGKIYVAENHLLFWNKNKSYTLFDDRINIHEPTGDSITEQHHILFDNEITTAGKVTHTDKGGNIWYSTDNNIIKLSLRKQSFELHLKNGPNDFPARARGIDSSPDGNFYVGYDNLYVANPNNKNSLLNPIDNLSGERVIGFTGMLYDKKKMWVCSPISLGVYSFETNRIERFPSEFLWMPYKAPDGTIWVGGGTGLFKLDTLKKNLIPFKAYNEFAELRGSSIYAFHLNEKGTWLSTSSGMYLVDLDQEKILAHYSDTQTEPFYIPANHIAHIYEDKEGIFWLASKGQGLIRWNPITGKSEQLSKGNTGLSHNVIYAVYEDDFGNLWLPSNYGLNCLNKKSRQTTLYLKEDGLPNNEFNTISHHQDAKGNLYFGTIDGMIKFDPKDFNQQGDSIPLILSTCHRIDRQTDSIINITKSVLEQHSLTIVPSDKAADFSFALLDYTKTKGNQYSYKIEGYHDNWIYQKEAKVRVGGLPYGNYKLHLRGKASASNTWIAYPPIAIKVAKPIYLQWWFILSSIFIAMGTIVFFVKRNNRQLLTRQEELEQVVKERTIQIEEDKAFIEAQSEELKALDKVKSKFFANISHELRTPLTLILGPLSYLLDDPKNWDAEKIKDEKIKKQLLVMQRNGKSLMQLIEEILDLSKLEANKLKIQETVTSVKEFFEYISAAFQPQFQNQGLDFALDFYLGNDKLSVLLDRKKMEKVLNNFLSNAIKFTPRNGKIILAISETDKLLKIKVSDTGKGVHPDDLPRIFERFYQSGQVDQELHGGTGIGLALVNEFATLMGGQAYAESTLGKGSHFYFQFPKKEVEIMAAITQLDNNVIEEEQIDSIGTDFTILVVEDNHDMQEFVCQLLKTRYKEVLSANNGIEGLEVLRERGPAGIQLIVSDVMMPEMDGLSMLREIKSSPEWNGIPVIMLTALAAERDKLAALTIGVDDYLTKPFSVTELLIRAQNLLFNYHQRTTWQEESVQHQGENNGIDVQTDPVPIGISPLQKEWVENIEQFIKDNLNKGVPDVVKLAAFTFLGKRQLTQKLKTLTGLTPAKLIKEVQLQSARKELENGTAFSVTEVAINHGFTQHSTFSTLFKKRFGKSPVEYLR